MGRYNESLFCHMLTTECSGFAEPLVLVMNPRLKNMVV